MTGVARNRRAVVASGIHFGKFESVPFHFSEGLAASGFLCNLFLGHMGTSSNVSHMVPEFPDNRIRWKAVEYWKEIIALGSEDDSILVYIPGNAYTFPPVIGVFEVFDTIIIISLYMISGSYLMCAFTPDACGDACLYHRQSARFCYSGYNMVFGIGDVMRTRRLEAALLRQAQKFSQ